MPKDFRVPIVIIALLLTLGISLGGFNLYNRYLVEKPFRTEMQKAEGIKRIELKSEKKKVTISLEMAKLEDFSVSYQTADAMARNRFGADGYTLEIIDGRNDKLQDVYDSLQLFLYQGIATNSFLWLDQEIGKIAGDNRITYKLRVDEKNLYLQLHQQDNYLYAVIKRGEEPGAEEKGR